jgi:hypothetical protein
LFFQISFEFLVFLFKLFKILISFRLFETLGCFCFTKCAPDLSFNPAKNSFELLVLFLIVLNNQCTSFPLWDCLHISLQLFWCHFLSFLFEILCKFCSFFSFVHFRFHLFFFLRKRFSPNFANVIYTGRSFLCCFRVLRTKILVKLLGFQLDLLFQRLSNYFLFDFLLLFFLRSARLLLWLLLGTLLALCWSLCLFHLLGGLVLLFNGLFLLLFCLVNVAIHRFGL